MIVVDYPSVNTKVIVIPKHMEFETGGNMDDCYINRYMNVGKFMGIVTNEWFYLYFLKYDIPQLWFVKNSDGTLGIYHISEVFLM